jgi:hypothetical protein
MFNGQRCSLGDKTDDANTTKSEGASAKDSGSYNCHRNPLPGTEIDEAGATFRSLGEAIETQSAAGRMMMQMLGCFAQFEREIIVERINRGLAHARANGRIGGGRYKLSPVDQMEAIRLIQVEKRSQGGSVATL